MCESSPFSSLLINDNGSDRTFFGGLAHGFFELIGFAALFDLRKLVAHLENLGADIGAQAAGNTFFRNSDFHKILLGI
jgi:hypothetical protein